MIESLDTAMLEAGLKLHSEKTKLFTNSGQQVAKPMDVNGRSVEVMRTVSSMEQPKRPERPRSAPQGRPRPSAAMASPSVSRSEVIAECLNGHKWAGCNDAAAVKETVQKKFRAKRLQSKNTASLDTQVNSVARIPEFCPSTSSSRVIRSQCDENGWGFLNDNDQVAVETKCASSQCDLSSSWCETWVQTPASTCHPGSDWQWTAATDRDCGHFCERSLLRVMHQPAEILQAPYELEVRYNLRFSEKASAKPRDKLHIAVYDVEKLSQGYADAADQNVDLEELSDSWSSRGSIWAMHKLFALKTSGRLYLKMTPPDHILSRDWKVMLRLVYIADPEDKTSWCTLGEPVFLRIAGPELVLDCPVCKKPYVKSAMSSHLETHIKEQAEELHTIRDTMREESVEKEHELEHKLNAMHEASIQQHEASIQQHSDRSHVLAEELREEVEAALGLHHDLEETKVLEFEESQASAASFSEAMTEQTLWHHQAQSFRKELVEDLQNRCSILEQTCEDVKQRHSQEGDRARSFQMEMAEEQTEAREEMKVLVCKEAATRLLASEEASVKIQMAEESQAMARSEQFQLEEKMESMKMQVAEQLTRKEVWLKVKEVEAQMQALEEKRRAMQLVADMQHRKELEEARLKVKEVEAQMKAEDEKRAAEKLQEAGKMRDLEEKHAAGMLEAKQEIQALKTHAAETLQEHQEHQELLQEQHKQIDK